MEAEFKIRKKICSAHLLPISMALVDGEPEKAADKPHWVSLMSAKRLVWSLTRSSINFSYRSSHEHPN